MSITTQEVEHLAKLARIQLTQKEKEKYTKDLSAILEYVEKLQEVKIGKTRDTVPVGSQEKLRIDNKDKGNHLRNDEVVGLSSLEQDELMNLAPEMEDRLIKSKAVFE